MQLVRKSFYFRGFLYHPNSQQFLLQQDSSDPKSGWTLLGDLRLIRPKPKAIFPVYDYVTKGKKHFISYAEVKNLQNFPPTKDFFFAWFNMKQILKLGLSNQAKQDVIVGRRVIDSQVRKEAGERTIG